MRTALFLGGLFWLLAGANVLSQEPSGEAIVGSEVSGPAGIEGVQAIVGLSVATGAVVIEQSLMNNQLMQRNGSQDVMLVGSFNQAEGIISVNQSAGNLDAQANVRLVIIGEDLSGSPLITVARSAVSEANGVNGVAEGQTSIQDSFNNTAGLVGINQSSGSLNQQINIALLSLGALVGPEAITLGETTLKNVDAHLENYVDDDHRTPQANSLINSFQGFQGIAQIQQAAGDGNSTANVLGLSVSIMDLP
jgi:hypothetical protein